MSRRSAEAGVAFALMVAAAVAVAAAVQAGNIQRHRLEADARTLTGGDPDRGHDAIVTLGCGACHVISGVTGADGRVGPSLQATSSQVYGAPGAYTPENLITWIKSPREIRPNTAMPDLGVDDQTARDIAAYLLLEN
jgi:cytochrome c